jgi:hypothetical protein
MFTQLAFIEIPSFCDGYCIATFTKGEVSRAETKHIKLQEKPQFNTTNSTVITDLKEHIFFLDGIFIFYKEHGTSTELKLIFFIPCFSDVHDL